MDADRIAEEKFRVYVDTMIRCRWFFLSSTLVTALIVIHLYVEQFSFQEQQVREMLQERRNDDAELAKLEGEIRDGRHRNWSKEVTTRFGDLHYKQHRRDNLERSIAIPDRSLPLLGMNVPGNDYLPIMGGVLVIIVLGTWLSLRNISSMLRNLDLRRNAQRPLQELVRFHFIFTGPIDVPAWEKGAAFATRMVAIWLPAAAFAVAIGIDIYSVVIGQKYNLGFFGSAAIVTLRYAVLSLELILMSSISLGIWIKAKEVHALATDEGLATDMD
jgi:hypothetical protein